MYGHNPWGGNLDLSMDSSHMTDHHEDNMINMEDIDKASLANLGHEDDQNHTYSTSWLLAPQLKNKKTKTKYVDLGCVVCSRKLLKIVAGSILATAIIIGLVVMIVEFVPHHHSHALHPDNYTLALHKTLLFFNAQKSGVLPRSNNISWRASSAVHDGQPIADLSGGYYDAGDNIKFGFPGAYTITVLSWSVIEYSAKYEALGELNHVKELIKWGSDYILKTFNNSADTITQIYAQVGDAPNDHSCWERPEDMDYERPVATCAACSDLAAEMAAALAAASIVFKKHDHRYSGNLLHGAELLFAFARGPRARYTTQLADASAFYNSTSYWDEFIWGSTWLYFATGNSSYLSLATNLKLAQHAGGIADSLDDRVFSWDNKLPGAQLLLTRLRIMVNPGYPYEDVLHLFNNQTDIAMCSYLPQFKAYNVTRGGLVQLNRGRPAPLQYNAAAAFLTSLYADYLSSSDVPGWNCGPTFLQLKTLRDFARSQIDYILGDNPNKMSYVVGYGSRYPTQVHHRGASIPSDVRSKGCTTALRYRDAKSPNPHILVGAMVAGPDSHDHFFDVRSNYNFTEPTIVGNALLTAALVALSGGDHSQIDTATLFDALPPLFPPSPPPPAPWKP